MNLEVADFKTIGETSLRQSEHRLAKEKDSCEEFNREVARLEAQTVQLYGFAALAAKREPDIDRTAQLWEVMVGVCEAFARYIGELSKKHPHCPVTFDRILDIRNRCQKMKDLHR